MNNYVDNVYIINMDKDIDRLEKVKKECDIVNIKFERFTGIKVSDLSQNILDKYVPEENQKYSTNSMIGCGLSHLFVWHDAIKKNYKNILVLEDDIYFTDDFNYYLKYVMEEVPDDYDILYLGYLDTCNLSNNSSFNYIYKSNYPLNLHGYIVSNKGLKKLINLIVKIDSHIDMLIANNIDKLNIYLSKKKIINQLYLNSNNSNLNNFPKLYNFILYQFRDCNNIPQSYYDNFQLYKYKNYIITKMTYNIFNLGILANIHNSILLLCLLYFLHDYETFYLIVFLLGYVIGYIFKYIMKYYKLNKYVILFLFILLIFFINKINLFFILIKIIL